MSRSIATIAELAWRQLNPGANDETRNTVEEYIESAMDIYATLAFTYYAQSRQDADFSLVESFLVRQAFDVQEDEESTYIELAVDVMNLPKDMGVFRVVPAGGYPLTKTTAMGQTLFSDDPTPERTYYREGRKIRFPERLAAKRVWVSFVTLDRLDETTEVPEMFAAPIRDGLVKLYAVSLQVPVDDTNNKNPNQ